MRRFRPLVIILIVAAAVVLAVFLSNGIRLRLFWGSSGFVIGVICGVLLHMEYRHRRELSKRR